MKKSLALFATVLAAVLNAATPSTSLVYKNTTTNALTGNIVAGNNTTISATGNGTITATALTGNITGNPTVSGNLTVSGTGTSTFAGNFRLQNTGYFANTATVDATTKLTIDTIAQQGIDIFRSDANANYSGIRFRNSANNATNAQIGWSGTSLRLEGTPVEVAGNLTVSGTGTFSNTSASTPTIALNTTQTSTGLSFLSTIGGAPSSERNWAILTNAGAYGDFVIRSSNAQGGNPITAGTTALTIDNSNNATFAGKVTSSKGIIANATPTSAEFSLDTSGNSVSVPANSTIYPFSNADNFSGMVLVNDINNTGKIALYITGGGITSLVAGDNTVWGGGVGASNYNLYVSSGKVIFQNNTASAVSFTFASIRTRAQQ